MANMGPLSMMGRTLQHGGLKWLIWLESGTRLTIELSDGASWQC